jgi:protein CpxP
MAKRSVILGAAGVLVAAIALGSAAELEKPQKAARGMRWASARMLRGLDLSPEQKERVRALVTAHRTATEPYRASWKENARAMREATVGGRFDEERARSFAQRQAEARVELTVAKERLRAEIYNLLTTEQRARLDERRARLENRIRER